MKTKSIFVLMFFIAFASKAQITITITDLPSIGDEFILAHDTIVDSLISHTAKLELTGSQYDFSGLDNEAQDTVTYVNPLSTIYGSIMTGSNLCAISSEDHSLRYLLKDSSALTVQGAVINAFNTGQMTVMTYSNPLTLLNIPYTYNDSLNDVGISEGSLAHKDSFAFTYFGKVYAEYADTLKLVRKEISNVVTVSYGQASTPSGAFMVLKNKYTIKEIDYVSVYCTALGGWIDLAPDTNIYFKLNWVAKDNEYPIAECNIAVDSFFVTNMHYLVNTSGNITSIADVIVPVNSQIYPNPADHQITMNLITDLDANVIVSVYNAIGKLVQENTFSNTDQFTIDISNLPGGCYYASLTGYNNNKHIGSYPFYKVH